MKFNNVCNQTSIKVSDQPLYIHHTPNTIERFHFCPNGDLIKITTSKNMRTSCLSIKLDNVEAYLAQSIHEKRFEHVYAPLKYLKKVASNVDTSLISKDVLSDTNVGFAFKNMEIHGFSYSKRISFNNEKNERRFMYYSADNQHILITERPILRKTKLDEEWVNPKVDLTNPLHYREEFVQIIDVKDPKEYSKTCTTPNHQDQGLIRALLSLKVDVAFDIKLEEKDKSKIHTSVQDQAKAKVIRFESGLHLLIEGEILSRANNGETLIFSPHIKEYFKIESTGFNYKTNGSPSLVELLNHNHQFHIPVLELNNTQDSIYVNEYSNSYQNKSRGLKHCHNDIVDYDFVVKLNGQLFDNFVESEHTNDEDDSIYEHFEWQVFEMLSSYSNEPEWGLLEIKYSHTEDENDGFTTFPPSFVFKTFENKDEFLSYLIKHSITTHLGRFCSYMLDSLSNTLIYQEL
jgi:hypothetical protein